MDNIRCLAMLAGIFLHVGLAYGENIGAVWYVQDNSSSGTLEVGFWFIHLFRMALFFFVAGFFAKLVVDKKGLGHFVKSRVSKVIIPFILCLPLVVLAINSLVFFALGYLHSAQPTLHLVAAGLPATNTEFDHFRTYHLWFIYYLAMFYAAAVILQDTNSALLSTLVSRCFRSRYSPLLVFVAIIPSHYFQSLPMPTPEGLMPELWVFGYYGVFFMYGWYFFSNRSALTMVATYWKPLLLLVIASYAVIYSFIPSFSAETPTVYSPQLKLLLAVLQSFCAVSLVLLSIHAGQSFMSRQNTFLYYLSRSSYTVYIVHLPIAILMQVFLAELALNVWVKYLAAMVLTFTASMLCYELVRQKDRLVTAVSGMFAGVPVAGNRSHAREQTS